ncbi:hypothetical protein DV515_00013172 [Chloebia gouldiae]|uniref:VWFC domain-containing protein n=1 Tax=Chloebia gouldiae TaxID=44316 RepID=A0A3L8S2L6_CHLGU|nr:hypothetical protein DV515_00013172 [Chloebia gouldiae]
MIKRLESPRGLKAPPSVFILLLNKQEGEVDCWPLQCPTLTCEYTAISEGECCPHCVSDPCLADNITYDIRKTCPDGFGITRLSGAVWTMVGSPCTTCKCKVRLSVLPDAAAGWELLPQRPFLEAAVVWISYLQPCSLLVMQKIEEFMQNQNQLLKCTVAYICEFKLRK